MVPLTQEQLVQMQKAQKEKARKNASIKRKHKIRIQKESRRRNRK